MSSLDFSGSPNAPVYAEQAAQANSAYQQALANIAAKRGQLYNQSGFQVSTNPDGTIKSYGVDGKNLTGGYQQMERAQGQQLEGQHESDISRHIGGVGIGAQNLSALRYGNGVAQSNFANNFLGQNEGLVSEQAQAGSDLQNTLLNLQLSAIADARANQTFPNSGDGSGDGGSDPTKTPTKPTGSNSLVQAAAQRALVQAKRSGKGDAYAALAARSAGMNARYGLGKPSAGKALVNAYVTGRKKRG